MIKHLLVPLDGSELAEASLPAAVYITRHFNNKVSLIHVVEENPPKTIHGQKHIRTEDEAKLYLEEIRNKYFPNNPLVKTHVHVEQVKNVAPSIVSHVDELSSDLIVLCTHGEGGISDYLVGSIAQQVISFQKVPVLLVQPTDGDQTKEFKCEKVLIPLDGNIEHEQGLKYAELLAEHCNQSLHLLLVVPNFEDLHGEIAAAGKFLRAAVSEYLEISEENAIEYLTPHVKRFEKKNIPVVAEICRGDPANIIVETADELSSDLIVIGTHGKTGMEAFWSGSVAPKISSLTKIPLLLVPAGIHAKTEK
jgi:nucleotide-binding universal stress UspA family protein